MSSNTPAITCLPGGPYLLKNDESSAVSLCVQQANASPAGARRIRLLSVIFTGPHLGTRCPVELPQDSSSQLSIKVLNPST